MRMLNISGNPIPSRRIRLGWCILCLLIASLAVNCASQGSTINEKDGRIKLAREYYRQQKLEKAKHELEIILLKNPKDIESLFLLGLIYGKQGSMNVSRSAFEKIISIDPQYSKAYYNIAVIYAKSKSPKDIRTSIRYFDKFLELEPGSKLRRDIENWKSEHQTP